MVSTVPAAKVPSKVISCSTKADRAVVKITEIAVPADHHGGPPLEPTDLNKRAE